MRGKYDWVVRGVFRAYLLILGIFVAGLLVGSILLWATGH